MTGMLEGLKFLEPSILALLTALPVLWFILRVTPPSPKLVEFPAARFLENLTPRRRTPSKTPWWILLIRILAAAAIITALAHPVLNPASGLTGKGPLRLIIDNGWESAQIRDRQMQAVHEALKQAGRENREVYILTTAADPQYSGPLSAAEAASKVKAMNPRPWPADYHACLKKLAEIRINSGVENIWAGTGITGSGFEKLATTLQSSGTLAYLRPAPEESPLLLRPGDNLAAGTGAEVTAPATGTSIAATIRALSRNEKIIESRQVILDSSSRRRKVAFDLPLELRGGIAKIDIQGRSSAGSTLWLDPGGQSRTIGIYSPAGQEERAPLTESVYYLKRALEPYASTLAGNVPDILAARPSAIILPDTGAMYPEALDGLEAWVRKGGLLIRFSGPRMAENYSQAFLIPAPLIGGERSMEGTLTWGQPKKLAPFPENSPFFDLAADPEVRVRRQLLADPGSKAEIWASLEDGTPLITAAPLGQGMLVMIHTTAGPEWSDLPLSGTYVQILKRLLQISANPSASIKAEGLLQPISISDGFGRLVEPASNVKPLDASRLAEFVPGPDHPPGIYGRAGYRVIVNLGEHLKDFKAAPPLPAGVTETGYGRTYETDLQPGLLLAASFLLLFDWLVMLLLASGLARAFHRPYAAKLAAACLLSLIPPHHARAAENDARYAANLHLAYVITGNPEIDAISEKGLTVLAEALRSRTSVEPEGVAGIDPEKNDLLFFPVIYWPIDPQARPLSNAAMANIQSYLSHGGTILFDTRDAGMREGSRSVTRNSQILGNLLAPLDIPPLIPAPPGHVLGKTFYLLKSYPGRFDHGDVWVEKESSGDRDGVSTVIIGGNDWAGAWAAESDIIPRHQKDLAIRFGINAVMYALTGNYKADQVHVPHILERLGK